MRRFLTPILLLHLIWVGGCDSSPAPPNLVLLVADDLGYADLGVTGSGSIRTPHIDALAAQGVRLTHFYTDGASCTPTRAAMLTGLAPLRLGLQRGAFSGSERGIPPEVPTFPQLLSRHGYDTLHLGKWHVGHRRPEYRPLAKGYDRFFGFLDFRSLGRVSYRNPRLQRDEEEPARQRGHLTDLLTERAVEFVRQPRAGPFLLSLWYLAPHEPWLPPERWARIHPDTEEGRYAALVATLDESVARIVAALDEAGVARDTLLVFTSDNGGVARGHGSDGPWRGFKGEFFEGGIRVPLIARWPARIPKGTVSGALATSRDLPATFLVAAGIEAHEIGGDGRVVPALVGTESDAPDPRSGEPLFWEALPDRYAVRHGAWKLIRVGDEELLFDLERDPREERDLRASHPEVAEKLRTLHRQWRAREGGIDFALGAVEGTVERNGDTWSFRLPGGRVRLESHPRLDPRDGDFSVSLWLRPDREAVEHGGWIVGQEGAWELALEAGGAPRLILHGARGDQQTLQGAEPLVAETWTHVVASWLGFNVFEAQLHANGARVASGPSLRLPPGAPPPVLGTRWEGGLPLRGRLRDVRFFAVGLSPGEVEELALGHTPGSARPSSSREDP